MMKNILFVFPDAQRDFYKDLMVTLESEFHDDNCLATDDSNLAHALRRLQGDIRFDLVVANIEFPLEPRSAPDPKAGLKLERWLRDNEINIPIVIVVPRLSSTLVSHPLSQVFENKGSLAENIINFAQHRAPPEKQLNIVLNLTANHGGSDWHYTIEGKNFPGLRLYDGDLKKLNDVFLENIIHFSEEVDNAGPENWESSVNRLCKNLNQVLIMDNDQFRMDLQDALRQVDTLNRTRVQFVVDEKVYPVLLEAVMSPDVKDNINDKGVYWMQHAPLVRYVSDRRTSDMLFQEEERAPINVLIIGSDTAGPAIFENKGIELTLDKLDNVHMECTELEAHLNKLKREGINLGEIRVIPSYANGSVNKAFVRHVIEEKHWNIVHYAGHSHLDTESGRAYVFFEDDDGFVDPVEIEAFAGYLRKTNMLILSSCTSAHQGFVFELAKNQIPAVLGFRTRIEDELAIQFSLDFYQILFEQRSVERAFYQARKHLYDNDATHHAWTNPVLVLESVA